MKHLFTAAAMLFSMTAFAQVGINNTSPKATLDITAKTTDGSKPEGLIIPQLSGSNIHTATAAGVYGTNQKGLIIYATSADSSPTSATANITAAGYYYFDGTNWQKVMTGSVANSDLTTGVGGIYKGSGSLSGNTTVTQGGNTLAFTSTATNGFSVDGTTLSVDAANNRIGLGTSTPLAPLHISAITTGDHLRMTNSASDWALSSENAGAQNGISGQPSFTIVNRLNSYRIMTIGAEGSFRLGGGISVGNSALSIDGPTNKVGIGINVPNATLDVKAASNGSTPEGIIAPRLSLTALQLYTYTSAQTGAIVYVNSVSGTPTGQTANVTAVGYYYFDGTNWQKVTNGASVTDATTSTKGIVQLAGDLTGTAASPSIAGNAVISAKIADGAVTAAKLNQMSATSGQVLGWNGSSWAPTASDTTNDAWINDTTNGLVKLGTKADGTARAAGADFVVKDNGQVGIGTSSPSSTLEINSGTANTSGLKFSNFNSSTTVGTGQALGVDASGNVITVPNSTAASVTTQEAFASSGSFNVNDLVWTTVSGSSQTITIPAGGKALFLNFMLGLDYFNFPAGGGTAYYTTKIYIDNSPTNVFQTAQESSAGAQAQFNLSCVKFLSAGTHTIDVRMSRTSNNGTTSGANMNCSVMSMSFNASYIN
jgi:hypothetical protein